MFSWSAPAGNTVLFGALSSQGVRNVAENQKSGEFIEEWPVEHGFTGLRRTAVNRYLVPAEGIEPPT
jgi:hypothetical protein